MRNTSILYVFAVALMLSACSAINNDNKTSVDDSCQILTPFVYDSFESKETWSALITFEEKMEACQVPVAITSSFTTKALIQTCLNHPLAGLYLAFEDEFEIVKILSSHNNAFKELLNRRDAANQLVDYYSAVPDICGSQMHFLELLIGSGLFPSMFKDPLSSQLKAAAEVQLASRRMMPEQYSIYSTKTAELIIRELQRKGAPSLSDASIILKEVESSGKPRVKSMDAYNEYYCYTAYNHLVIGRTYPELGDDAIADADSIYSAIYPNAVLLESTSQTYNCHAYAWTMPLSGDICWIDTNGVSEYTDDETYEQVYSFSSADVVFDLASDFSAIPTSTPGVVISKWPNGPVMQHSLNQSPYGTITPTYYKLSLNNIKGQINGETLASTNTPYTYTYSLNDSYVSWISCGWDVANLHDNVSTACSYYTSNGNLYITFYQTGEYYLTCHYYAYGLPFSSKQVTVNVLSI